MSGSDVTDSSTQVTTVRCVWVPVTMSCHVRHEMSLFPEISAAVALTRY
jgi:hypothetical protein